MACYYPIQAFRLENGSVVFAERGNVVSNLVLPCGRCFGCRLDRSKMWAIRCMHEAQMHDVSSFVTLTYDEDHMPVNGCLNYKHFQDFMKRLRKRFGPTRFYMCGEYGETTWRPHFHACLFGLFFADRVPFKQSGSVSQLYVSKVLQELWPFGHSSIGDVTFESAAYCARYVMKKVNGDRALEHYTRVNGLTGEVHVLTPEFAHMSLKPGIGGTWFAKFKSDVFGDTKDGVVIHGRKFKPPRYYDKLLERICEDSSEWVKYMRYLKPLQEADQTEARLRDREAVSRAKVGFFNRNVGE